jgi:hypothetical protein
MKFLIDTKKYNFINLKNVHIVKNTNGLFGIFDESIQTLIAEGTKQELEIFLKLQQVSSSFCGVFK